MTESSRFPESGLSGPEGLVEKLHRTVKIERALSGYPDLPLENIQLVGWSCADGARLLDAINAVTVYFQEADSSFHHVAVAFEALGIDIGEEADV